MARKCGFCGVEGHNKRSCKAYAFDQMKIPKPEPKPSKPEQIKKRKPVNITVATSENDNVDDALEPLDAPLPIKVPKKFPKTKFRCDICSNDEHTTSSCSQTKFPKTSKQDRGLIGKEPHLEKYLNKDIDHRRYCLMHPSDDKIVYRRWLSAAHEEVTSRLSNAELGKLPWLGTICRKGVKIKRTA